MDDPILGILRAVGLVVDAYVCGSSQNKMAFTGTFFQSFGILNVLQVLTFAIFMQTCKFKHHYTHVHSDLHENCQRKFMQ